MSILVTIISILGFPLALSALIWVWLPSNTRFEFDYYEKFSFFAIHSLLRRVTTVLIVVSLTILLLKSVSTPIAVSLILTVLYSALFETWLVTRYESYLHAKYPLNLPPDLARRLQAYKDTGATTNISYEGPSNYTPLLYAITWGLGLSAVISFVTSLVLMVISQGGR